MKTYVIYYWKYEIFARDYVFYIKLVETNDIYHEIGKMICTSIEHIKSIRYTYFNANEINEYKHHLDKDYCKLTDNLYTNKNEND